MLEAFVYIQKRKRRDRFHLVGFLNIYIFWHLSGWRCFLLGFFFFFLLCVDNC